MLHFPRRLTVAWLRSLETVLLRLGGRRWKIDRFNRLIENDVRETVAAFRAARVNAIVGIPFYKEAENLPRLVEFLARDLAQRGESAGLLIVGERKTSRLLAAIELPAPPPGVLVRRLVKPHGFGQKPGLSRRSWSHWAMLQIAGRTHADIVFIDADVRNAQGWVRRYLDAIQNHGATLAVANYVRDFARDDAIVHLWDSLIFGALFRRWIAFRHGGDYAISRHFIPAVLARPSIMRERTYTMDSAVIARAVQNGGRVEPVWLGTKEHQPIEPRALFDRLPDLVRSVFDDVSAHLPALLRMPREEIVPETAHAGWAGIFMRDLAGADFRQELYADMTQRFHRAAQTIRRTTGSARFAVFMNAISSAPERILISPRDWAKATLRFLTRYIRRGDAAGKTTLVNAYVPILEMGVLGFLNRTFELSYEDSRVCLRQEYLPEFQRVWNRLSRGVAVYRMAALRRLPARAVSGLLAGIRNRRVMRTEPRQ